jgi:glycine/D-amino acid oxidase-like deaminating enzyme
MQDSTAHIAIIGGGIMGSFCGFFLRHLGFRGRITIIERDPSYRYTATARSAASFRTQFSCKFNVAMSVFGAEFLKNTQTWLNRDSNIGLIERGYLILHKQAVNHTAIKAMHEAGAEIAVFPKQELQQRYPYLNIEDISHATYGLKNEGWFDAWSLLQAVQAKNRTLDCQYRHENVKNVPTGSDGQALGVVLEESGLLEADWVINAAGPESAAIHQDPELTLPVSPRKRTVFSIRSPLNDSEFPMLIDTSGVWIRPEGQGHICGIVPPPNRDPAAHGDYQPDYDLFEEYIWPALAQRIPQLESLKMENAWAGHYEVNSLDHNGIVGPHPDINNLYFATGFSGHGLQHAPAVGRGIAEHLLQGAYQSIDLTPLGYQRIVRREAIVERSVY